MQILFYLKGSTIALKTFRNPRNTNWDEYRECLKQSLDDFSPMFTDTVDLDACIERPERAIIQAYYNNCPEKTHRSVGKTP